MPQRRLRDRDEVAGICICEQLIKKKKRQTNNTIEPEAEFLSEIRPSVVPEAKPRALREV